MMQDNSFEKNIDLQLHDLHIEPSEGVWNAVEKELDKKKRRYLFGWWFLPLLLIVIGGIGFIVYHFSQQPAATTETTNIAEHKDASPAQKQPAPSAGIISNTGDRSASNASAPETNNNQPRQAKNSAYSTVTTATAQTTTASSMISSPKKKLTATATQKINMKAGNTGEELTEGEKTTPLVTSEATPEPAKKSTEELKKDSAADLAKEEIQENSKPDITITDTAGKPVVAPQQKKGKAWNMEWAVAGGKTKFTTFDFSKKDEGFLYSPDNTGAIPTPGVNMRERTEYRFRPGAYAEIGVRIGRQLSKKISFLSGLHYNYQSTNIDRRVSIDTITVVGTSVSYTTLSSTLYKERLNIHSINIPLLVRWNIHKSISIDAGLNNSIIISSGWSRYTGILGKQKTYLPALHVNPAFVSNKFSAGPFVNIGLRQYDINKNMVNYGLMLKYSFKK